MERFSYDEIKQDIRGDYARYMEGGYNFSFYGATSKILDDFQRVIRGSEVESVMLYTILAKIGLEHGKLRPQIKEEVQRIIDNGIVSKFKDELSSEEFSEISQDLINVKDGISA